jgi:hypothetical protein
VGLDFEKVLDLLKKCTTDKVRTSGTKDEVTKQTFLLALM